MTHDAPVSQAPSPQPDYSATKPPRLARIWPAIAIVILMWMAMKLPTYVAPGSQAQFLGIFFAPMVGAAAIVIWWLAASRVQWSERFIGIAAFIAGGLI